jgi:4-amino-4-deoxy-L-arabinose transferase-like glycosyltransferase
VKVAGRIPYLAVYLIVLLVAAVAHFAFIGITPWDWDDSVYTNIAQHVAQLGYPALTPEPDKTFVPFLYHPPFYFYGLSAWYTLVGDSSIYAGRALSSLLAVVAVGLCVILIEKITENRRVAILAGLFLALDGWFTYSSTLVKLDVGTLILGMMGLLLYTRALREDSVCVAMLAGIAIGAALIYKHTGIIIAGAVIINWLVFVRRQHQLHYRLLGVALAVVIVYVGTMYAIWGEEFLDQSAAQIRRSLGLQVAPGLNFGIGEALRALWDIYWIFTGTILVMLAGMFISLIRTWQVLLKRKEDMPTLLLAWVISGGLVMILLKLHNPHYLVMFAVPLLGIVAYELNRFSGGATKGKIGNIALFVITGVMLLNFFTLGYRAMVISDNNVIQAAQGYISENVPPGESILAVQPVCVTVKNPCYEWGAHRTRTVVQELKPDYVVVYTSTAYSLPVDESFARNTSVVFETAGWNKNITVYRVKKGLSAKEGR